MAITRPHQRGNVFFLILLGIAMFAMVSMAIMQSTRGGKDITREKSRLLAETIMRYGREAKDATTRIYQKGVSEADIRFAHPKMAADYGAITDNPTNQMFADEGGGLPYTIPPADAVAAATNWEIYGTSAIPQVGSALADLVLVLPNVKPSICQQINALNGYAEEDAIPTDSNVDGQCIASANASDRFTGTFATGGAIHAPGTTGFLTVPAYQACVNCGGVYTYYNVLMER